MKTLKVLMCGTSGVTSQIAKKWNLVNSLNNLSEELKGDNVSANAILEIARGVKKLINPIVSRSRVIMSRVKRQTKKRMIHPDERQMIKDNCDKQFPDPSEAFESTKIRKGGHVYTSIRYKEGKKGKKCDFMVVVRKDNKDIIAAIEYFFTPIHTQETFCFLSPFEHLPCESPDSRIINNSEAKHCFYMRQQPNHKPLVSCLLSDVVGKCIIIEESQKKFYVVKVPSLKAFE